MNLFKKAALFLFAILIAVLALFPRSVDVLNGNPVFGFDQGRDYLAVRSIVIDHKLTLIGAELGAGAAGISGLFHGPFYYYMLTAPFVAFNGDPRGGTYLMLVLALTSIIFGTYFAYQLFGKVGAAVAAILLSSSPILISQARFTWNPHTPTLFILLSLYFTYRLAEKKKLYVFLAAFFAGFVYNFESANSIPLSIAIFIYSIYVFRTSLRYYLFLILGFIVAYSPMIVFEARHGFLGFSGLVSYLINREERGAAVGGSVLSEILNAFLINFRDTFAIENKEIELLLLVFLAFSTFVFLRLEKVKRLKQFIYFLLILIPVHFLVFSRLNNAIWSYYLLVLSLVYVFIFSYVFFSSIVAKRYFLTAVYCFFVFIILASSIQNSYKVSLYDFSDYGGTAKLRGKVDAIDFIYKDVKGAPFGLFIFSPPIYTYPYDYIVWWYGKSSYNYIPHNEKKGEFYLLIEPDPGKPWTYKGWLETVIKSGKVLWTKELPSGFIVQKRVI